MTLSFSSSYVKKSQPNLQDFINTNQPFLTNNPSMLAWLYAKEGLIRRIVQTMVDDALTGGLNIHLQNTKSNHHDNNFEHAQTYVKRLKLDTAIRQVFYYARLYGGGALLLDTNEPLHRPLFHSNQKHAHKNASNTPSTPMENILHSPNDQKHAIDSLHLIPLTKNEIKLPTSAYPYNFSQQSPLFFSEKFLHNLDANPITVYDKPVHPSRLIFVLGDMASPALDFQFQGWGMSVIDMVDTAITPYLQLFEDTMDFLDQAKLDIYKIKNYGTMASQKMKMIVDRRISDMNARKNLYGAIILDADDQYEQKIMESKSLVQFFPELRMRISMACGIPMSRLFGSLNKGFSTGEDDLEIYHQTIESSIRSKMSDVLNQLFPLISFILFGHDNILGYSFKPLRVQKPKDEDALLNSKVIRLQNLYDAGLLTSQEFMAELSACHIFSTNVDINKNIPTHKAVDQDDRDNQKPSDHTHPITPVGGSPVGETPFGETPFDETPVDGSPVGGSPVGGSSSNDKSDNNKPSTKSSTHSSSGHTQKNNIQTQKNNMWLPPKDIPNRNNTSGLHRFLKASHIPKYIKKQSFEPKRTLNNVKETVKQWAHNMGVPQDMHYFITQTPVRLLVIIHVLWHRLKNKF